MVAPAKTMRATRAASTERRPPELRHPPLRDGYLAKLVAGYDWLEAELDDEGPLHIGHIAVATALDWLRFRGLPDFREGHPRLSTGFERFAARASMRATPLSGDTHD